MGQGSAWIAEVAAARSSCVEEMAMQWRYNGDAIMTARMVGGPHVEHFRIMYHDKQIESRFPVLSRVRFCTVLPPP